eukprot:Gb_19915 [translate_table: standard]
MAGEFGLVKAATVAFKSVQIEIALLTLDFQMPDMMRSLGIAVYVSIFGVGSIMEVQEGFVASRIPKQGRVGVGYEDMRYLPSHSFCKRRQTSGRETCRSNAWKGFPSLRREYACHQVGRMAGQLTKPRSKPFKEVNGMQLPSYGGDNINGDSFDEKSFAIGGYAAMLSFNQWNLSFTEHSEQGDMYLSSLNIHLLWRKLCGQQLTTRGTVQLGL